MPKGKIDASAPNVDAKLPSGKIEVGGKKDIQGPDLNFGVKGNVDKNLKAPKVDAKLPSGKIDAGGKTGVDLSLPKGKIEVGDKKDLPKR